MTKTSQVQKFENRKWDEKRQEIVWRHKAALQLISQEPVLDVGGGDGLFLSYLRSQKGFNELTLLDVSSVATRKAQERGIAVRLADITEPLPFADKSFGTTCALDVLEHLHDPIATLAEMVRVSRWLVLVVPNFQYWQDRARVLVGIVPSQCKPKRGHVYWFNYTVLQEMVSAVGCEVDSVICGGFVRAGSVGRWLAQLLPNLFAHSFAVRLKSP